MPRSQTSTHRSIALRMILIRWAAALLVVLGATGSETAAAFAESPAEAELTASSWMPGGAVPSALDTHQHHAPIADVCDASSEEEEERDDQVAAGDDSAGRDERPAPRVFRLFDGCERWEPTSVRFRLDARGPPAR